jgi:hypothetical protein
MGEIIDPYKNPDLENLREKELGVDGNITLFLLTVLFIGAVSVSDSQCRVMVEMQTWVWTGFAWFRTRFVGRWL